jgi:hypothetical protein
MVPGPGAEGRLDDKQSKSICTACGNMDWIPHNASFGFLDIASAILGRIYF